MIALSKYMSKNSETPMNDKKQSIYDIASWFLDKESMSHKKLQKLSYYAVAWGYALLDRPIVEKAEFEAWIHGPVSQSLWSSYGIYGWVSISKKTQAWRNTASTQLSGLEFPKDVLDLLEAVWVTYGSKSALELEALSHKELPWVKARNGIKETERSNAIIAPSDMRGYYSSIYIAG